MQVNNKLKKKQKEKMKLSNCQKKLMNCIFRNFKINRSMLLWKMSIFNWMKCLVKKKVSSQDWGLNVL